MQRWNAHQLQYLGHKLRHKQDYAWSPHFASHYNKPTAFFRLRHIKCQLAHLSAHTQTSEMIFTLKRWKLYSTQTYVHAYSTCIHRIQWVIRPYPKCLKMFIGCSSHGPILCLDQAHMPSIVCMHLPIVRVNEIKAMVDPLMISELLIGSPTICDNARARQDMPCYYW